MDMGLLQELQDAGVCTDQVPLRDGTGDVPNLEAVTACASTQHVENTDDGTILFNGHMIKAILRHPCTDRINRIIRAAGDKTLSWRGNQLNAQTCLIVSQVTDPILTR